MEKVYWVDGAIYSKAEFETRHGARLRPIESNPLWREELQGEPALTAHNGPMWGGETIDGRPIIRYETPIPGGY